MLACLASKLPGTAPQARRTLALRAVPDHAHQEESTAGVAATAEAAVPDPLLPLGFLCNY